MLAFKVKGSLVCDSAQFAWLVYEHPYFEWNSG